MSTHKRIDRICAVTAVLTVLLTVLFMNGKAFGITPIVSESASSDMFTANDLDAAWDTSSATRISLSDQGSTVSGNGAYVYDGDVYIVYAGRYVLTGGLTDGSIIINGTKSDKIWLYLDGVTIHCEDDAAIRIEQAAKVFLTLAEGTQNTLSSGAVYDSEIAASGVDGTIYSRDDLTINGSGSLTVDGAYSHGIVCNDDLAVTGGDITIRAVQDGIHANDSVRIREAALSISAGDDGITVSNDDETAFLYVESGTITIPACYEGLEAIDITIAGGTIDIVSTDDGINANGTGTRSVIRITGGDIRILNPDGRDADGLDSNGSIYIEGGSTFISLSGSGGNCALDYGSENGGECVISGGTVIACGGSAMAEGFSADSPQGFLMYTTAAEAGTSIRLEDPSGRTLLSTEIPYSFTSVVLSAPELAVGDTCTLTVGGTQEQIVIDNTASSFGPGGMSGGGMRGDRGERPDRQGAGMGLPDGADMPEGLELPDPDSMPNGGRPDRQEGWEDGGRPFPPDGGQPGDRTPSQDQEQTALSGERLSDIPAGTWALVSVSGAVLLAGLFIACKFEH